MSEQNNLMLESVSESKLQSDPKNKNYTIPRSYGDLYNWEYYLPNFLPLLLSFTQKIGYFLFYIDVFAWLIMAAKDLYNLKVCTKIYKQFRFSSIADWASYNFIQTGRAAYLWVFYVNHLTWISEKSHSIAINAAIIWL